MQVEAVHGRLSSSVCRRGCEEQRDESGRASHAGIRDTRGLHLFLCLEGDEIAESEVYCRDEAQSNGQHESL